MQETEIRMYSLICSNDGIKARDIAREVGVSKTDINRLLYNAPFIHELCYRDSDYNWHGLIRQARPHEGLSDFCGYFGSVERFQKQDEEEQWLTLFRLNGKLYCGEAEEHAPSIRCQTPFLISPEMVESAAVCFEQWLGNVRFSTEIRENRKVIKRTLRHADVLMACVRVFSEY